MALDFLGRYEYKKEGSDKFWQVERTDSGFRVTWGKIGTRGTSQDHDVISAPMLHKKAQEKIRKGYEKIGFFISETKPKAKAAESAVVKALKDLAVVPSVRDKVAQAAKIAAAKKSKEVKEEPKAESVGVELVHPSRCTADLPDDLSLSHLVAEPKMDGSRYVMYLGCSPYDEGANALLSRRESAHDGKYVNKVDNVPHLFKAGVSDLTGTVLDGEIMSSTFLATNSIMNSSPRLAIEKQNKDGLLDYHVFDVIYYCGTDVRHRPLSERRKIMEYIVTVLANDNVKLIEQRSSSEHDFTEWFKEITSGGGEGLIIKDSRRSYGSGWAKMKKSYDISCIITGFKAGTGKYAAGVGSIALSVIADDGDVVEVGFASGFDDKLRGDMSKNPEKYIGRVVDVFAQEIQDSKKSKSKVGRLRHPTFHRLRDDISKESCTAKKMWEDFKKVKSERAKKFGS